MNRRLYRGHQSRDDWADAEYQSAREEEAMADHDRRREGKDMDDENGPTKAVE